jgi:hypothetical protein
MTEGNKAKYQPSAPTAKYCHETNTSRTVKFLAPAVYYNQDTQQSEYVN